jgi:hypothetical protein
MTLEDRSDSSVETARRRAERADHHVEVPANERTRVECPGCECIFKNSIVCGDPKSYFPTYGTCTNWECDAFLQFRWNGEDGAVSDEEDDEPAQTGLDAFAGGESA